METPDNPEEFSKVYLLSLRLEPTEIDILFEKATSDLSAKSWFKTSGAEHWQEILSFPRPRPQKSFTKLFSQAEAQWLNDERVWGQQASAWFKQSKQSIGMQQSLIKRCVEEALPLLNAQFHTKRSASDVLHLWYRTTKILTLNEFLGLIKFQQIIGEFLGKLISDDRNKLIHGLPDVSSNEIKSIVSESTKRHKLLRQKELKVISDIWKGSESDFWRLVKTYAADYVYEENDLVYWKSVHDNISYLAGFIRECQQKEWIQSNAHSAPTLQQVLQNALNISFDLKPFKNANLNGIDPKYRQPFKSLPYYIGK